jgi:hypothetical protein
MLSFGGVDHKLVQDLANIESSVGEPTILQSAMQAGAKTVASMPGKESIGFVG